MDSLSATIATTYTAPSSPTTAYTTPTAKIFVSATVSTPSGLKDRITLLPSEYISSEIDRLLDEENIRGCIDFILSCLSSCTKEQTLGQSIINYLNHKYTPSDEKILSILNEISTYLSPAGPPPDCVIKGSFGDAKPFLGSDSDSE